ncbi:MAG TPA: hypothetical protein VKT49_08095, partial [Bryobacteraceae bacterium]|nr:hypothetical protein [Bryobacteraceae bacterium]
MLHRSIAEYLGYALAALLLAVGAALFYFGGFNYLLANDSSSFSVELALAQSRAHRDATVVVLGNSTASEDFRANQFNQRSPGKIAVNLGVPSAQMYLFDRLLSMSIERGLRPRIVVLFVTPEILSLRSDFDYLLNDLTMLKTELSAADLARLASHARDLPAYVNYASYVAARPVLFRGELRDFFTHPAWRLKAGAVTHAWLASFEPGSPMIETNNPFSVCDAGPLPALEQTISRLRREGRPSEAGDVERVRAAYAARVHQRLQVDRFEAVRFRRLLQRLAARSQAVYVVPAPYYDPDYDQYPSDYRVAEERAIREIAAGVSRVKLLPEFPADCHLF